MSKAQVFIDSPICWYGKKTKLLPQLLPLFPTDRVNFLDLFGGSGSVTVNVIAQKDKMNFAFNKFIFNDVFSGQLISILSNPEFSFEQIMAHFERRIKEFDLGREDEKKENYYKFKEFITNTDNYERGNTITGEYYLDLLCLSLFAFNGTLEFSQKDFAPTSSFGKRNRIKVFQKPLKLFKAVMEPQINNLSFFSKDYKDLIEFLKPIFKKKGNDYFVYADVPYSITRTQGYNYNFKDSEVFAVLDALNELGVKWGVSNVFEHRGKKNDGLIKWAAKYNVHHLNKDYCSIAYQDDLSEKNKTDEVYICNYDIKEKE